MKATVKKVFVDKYDNLKQYNIGEVIEIADKTRLENLEERGFVVAEKETVEAPKKTATKSKRKVTK